MDKPIIELPILLNDSSHWGQADWFLQSVKKKTISADMHTYYYKISVQLPFELEFRIQRKSSLIIINNQEITNTINFSYYHDGVVNWSKLDDNDKNILYNQTYVTEPFEYSFNFENSSYHVYHSNINFLSIFQIYQFLLKFSNEVLCKDYFQLTEMEFITGKNNTWG
jgi:hypothetical protein